MHSVSALVSLELGSEVQVAVGKNIPAVVPKYLIYRVSQTYMGKFVEQILICSCVAPVLLMKNMISAKFQEDLRMFRGRAH